MSGICSRNILGISFWVPGILDRFEKLRSLWVECGGLVSEAWAFSSILRGVSTELLLNLFMGIEFRAIKIIS